MPAESCTVCSLKGYVCFLWAFHTNFVEGRTNRSVVNLGFRVNLVCNLSNVEHEFKLHWSLVSFILVNEVKLKFSRPVVKGQTKLKHGFSILAVVCFTFLRRSKH